MIGFSKSIKATYLCRALCVAVGLVWFLAYGCTDLPPDNNNQNGPGQSQPNGNTQVNAGGEEVPDTVLATPENLEAVTAALDTIDEMIDEGQDINSTFSTLLDQLQDNSNVIDAGWDQSADVVWAGFADGEIHHFLIKDDSTDPEVPYEQQIISSAKSHALATAPNTGGTHRGAIQTQAYQPYRIADNNHAILLNALARFHPEPLNDSTVSIGVMLHNAGYDVNRDDLTLAAIGNLTSNSVVLLETHGSHYTPLSLPLPPSVEDGDKTCYNSRNTMSLLTTTPRTLDNYQTYSEDVFCGRLTIWHARPLQEGTKGDRTPYYGVTPDYIRKYVTGNFPNNTLMVLNACRGVAEDLSSPFKDLLFEKCDEGAWALMWTNRVHRYIAVRAALNLFQVLSCGTEKYPPITLSDGKKFDVLESPTPPLGNGAFVDTAGGWAALQDRLYMTDLGSGAVMERWQQSQDHLGLILRPVPVQCSQYSYDGPLELNLVSGLNPTVTIGTTIIPAQRADAYGTIWNLTVPAGTSGSILITEGGKSSIARTLHRWQPQIVVRGNDNGMQYEVNFTLLARGTVENFRVGIWETPPPADFNTRWHGQASTVGWSVSGERTSGNTHYSFSGTGLQSLSDASASYYQGGALLSLNGRTVRLDVGATISYTVTETNTQTGAANTYNETRVVSVYEDVPLNADWSVNNGSSTHGDETVIWHAFAAQPPFVPEAEPR